MLSLLLVVPAAGQAAGFTEREVTIPMSDGVRLVASEFVPDTKEKVPVVVGFYPYGRRACRFCDTTPFPAEHGYAKLLVDVRGTGASEGVYNLLGEREQADYGEVIRFAAARPYSNGSVGLNGASYGGIAALLAAEQPGTEAVKAVTARTPLGDAFRDVQTFGGAANTGFLTVWSAATILAPSLYQPTLSAAHDPEIALNATTQHLLGTTPYLTAANLNILMGARQGELPESLSAIPDASYDGPHYRAISPLSRIDRIRAPTLIVGANRDIFARTEPLLWDALPLPPSKKKLVSVDGYHFFGPEHLSSDDGTRVVRDDRGNAVPGDQQLRLRWLDHWLRGRDNGAERMPAVRQAYTGGQGFVAQDTALPPRRPRAFALDGGGRLTPDRPGDPGSADLAFQPFTGICSQSPVQNLGAPAGEVPPCTTEARVNEIDGLAFTSAPVDSTTRLAGPANLSVWIRSTKPDTNVVGLVSDVSPDGSSKPVSYGALVASHRVLRDRPCATGVVLDCSVYLGGELIQPWHPYTRADQAKLTPGEVYRLDIEIMPIFLEVKPGHRLRLTLKAGDFPHATPTLSTLEDAAGGVTTILFDREHPSTLTVGEVTGAAPVRLLIGRARGMRRARHGRPARVRVRVLGGRVRAVRVLVRDRRGRIRGRSRRFGIGGRRTRVRVRLRVRRPLRARRYRLVAAGRTMAGERVAASRRVRLRRR